MAKKKRQRQWVTGAEYKLHGSWGRSRRVRLVGTGKLDGRKTLFLQPLRKLKKKAKKGGRKR